MESIKLKNEQYLDASGVFDHLELKTQEDLNIGFKKDISDLNSQVNTSDPLFNKIIKLPDDDSFFNKGSFTGTGTYTKLSNNALSISGGSGTTYYAYPLHGTNRVVSGSNSQIVTRILPSDLVEIPDAGAWGQTIYSLGIQAYLETNSNESNRNLDIVVIAASIANGEFTKNPVIIASNTITNYKKYGTAIIRLRGTGYAPFNQYTHYGIYARSRSRSDSTTSIASLKIVQSPRLLQYMLYPDATVESSLTAEYAHASNSYILYNERLYKVIAPISAGDELIVGTNVTQTSILEQLMMLDSKPIVLG